KTWVDVSTYADPGYPGVLASSSNPLSNRMGFVGLSPSYPALETVALDLGTALAGQEIRLRFRVGSDSSVGAPGWEIDNIGFTGVTNTPFPGAVDDQSEFGGEAPTTSAGEDTSSSSGSG